MSDLKQRLIDMANDFKSRAMFNNEANALKALERIKALEAALKPFAELKPVSWSLDADMFYIDTDDIRHAASLLEKKPAVPSVEHITGVALKEPDDRPGRYLRPYVSSAPSARRWGGSR